MRNDYEQHVKWREYCDMMQALSLGTRTDQGESNLPQADDVRINDLGPVMRAQPAQADLVAPVQGGLSRSAGPQSFSSAPSCLA